MTSRRAAGLLAALTLGLSGCSATTAVPAATVASSTAAVPASTVVAPSSSASVDVRPGVATSPSPGKSAASTPASATAPAASATASTAAPATTAAAGKAIAVVNSLAVKGRAPKTGYERSEFGQTWADVDRNGCDTRNDILRRDVDNLVVKPGTNGCVAASGTLVDPYGGRTIWFERGDGEVQIDHVVALSDAWQKGAQQWTLTKRTAFANDPLNLLAVSSSLNLQKSDSDAASWLPPSRAYRCAFVARQAAVKAKYGLWVTSAERAAMLQVLAACPTQGVLAANPVPAIVR